MLCDFSIGAKKRQQLLANEKLYLLSDIHLLNNHYKHWLLSNIHNATTKCWPHCHWLWRPMNLIIPAIHIFSQCKKYTHTPTHKYWIVLHVRMNILFFFICGRFQSCRKSTNFSPWPCGMFEVCQCYMSYRQFPVI